MLKGREGVVPAPRRRQRQVACCELQGSQSYVERHREMLSVSKTVRKSQPDSEVTAPPQLSLIPRTHGARTEPTLQRKSCCWTPLMAALRTQSWEISVISRPVHSA